MSDFIRYGWPRRYLLRLCDYLPDGAQERLLDFLYPDDMVVSITPERNSA